MQSLYKNWLLVSKITWGIWKTSDKQWKVQKFKFDRLLLSKKCIPLAKTYTEDLSNITFNYLCENSLNSLCHYWNHNPFFTTELLCIQSAHFQTFPLLALKFTKFLMPFFKQKVSFPSKFCVMRDNSSVLFIAETLSVIDKRSRSKPKLSDFWLLTWKFTKSLCRFSNHQLVFL